MGQDPGGLDDGDPGLRRTLALPHSGLGGLLRDRLVGEDADPELAAALDVALDRDAAGLDLPRGEPARLERLQAELAEGERPAAQGGAPPAPLLLLPVLDLGGHQHGGASLRDLPARLRRGGGRPCRSST